MIAQQAPFREFVAGLDLLPVIEADYPALAGQFKGSMTPEVACPKCGGETRFRVRMCGDGIMRAYCSHCAPRGLDAVDYITWRDGCDRKTACRWWRERIGTRSTPAARPFTPPTPRTASAPSQAWQDHARAFAQACADLLWTPAGSQALDYLRARGLSDDTIRRAGLGINPSARRADGEAWGIDGTVTAAAGITIPRNILGELWAVNIRQSRPDAKPKYKFITGSRAGLAGADDLRDAAHVFVFGGEFDCLLARQYAPAGVACVTFGGELHAVGHTWLNMIGRRAAYVALDNDDAGDQGAVQWIVVPQARRVRVPQGKDLTDYWRAGGDVAAWMRGIVADDAGLVDALLAWGERKGYSPNVATSGGIVLARPELIGAVADRVKADTEEAARLRRHTEYLAWSAHIETLKQQDRVMAAGLRPARRYSVQSSEGMPA